MNEATDLVLERVLKAPRPRVWAAWTQPDLLKQWWCPKPWHVAECRIDLRPGGELYTLMRGPDGEEHTVAGCWLDIEEGRRIVFTLMLQKGFRPALVEGMFRFTAEVSFADTDDGRTFYKAHLMHAAPADRDEHARVGFHDGWNTAATQLEEVLAGG